MVIADAYSVAHARMVAAGLAAGRYVDGHRINSESVARLPRDEVGRVLTIEELAALLKDKKKPPAPSVRRSGGAGAASNRDRTRS